MTWTPTEEFKATQSEARKANPSLADNENDKANYTTLMADVGLPLTVTASIEFQWVAFNIEPTLADWASAPSKVAVQWLRRLRMNTKSGGRLKAKFWGENWTFYMENRLALELRSGVVSPASKKRGAANRTDADIQASIEKMTTRRPPAPPL